MQTFLPYPSFTESASVLDDRRLGNQRNEALVIYKTLTGQYTGRGGWPNHPCTKMWRGFEPALAAYFNTIVAEWVKRGFKNSHPQLYTASRPVMPHWLGVKNFHDSHKSALLRKNQAWYSRFSWNVPIDLPYVWPSPFSRGEI